MLFMWAILFFIGHVGIRVNGCPLMGGTDSLS